MKNTVQLVFFVDENSEIEVINAEGKNEELADYVTKAVDGKRLYVKPTQKGKIYSMDVVFIFQE